MVTKDLDYSLSTFFEVAQSQEDHSSIVTVLLNVYVAHRLIVYSIIKLDTETPLQR